MAPKMAPASWRQRRRWQPRGCDRGPAGGPHRGLIAEFDAPDELTLTLDVAW